MTDMIKVRLLVSRTGLGKAGDVVDYPAEDIARHAAMGLIQRCVPLDTDLPDHGESDTADSNEDSDEVELEAGETSRDDAPIASAPPSRKKRK